MLPEVQLNDKVGRAICSRRDARAIKNNKCRPKIFDDQKSLYAISVDRFGFCSDKELTKIQEQRADRVAIKYARECSFYGWAQLKVEDIQQVASVKASPVEENPYHADICLPTNESEDERIAHLHALAAHAQWRSKSVQD